MIGREYFRRQATTLRKMVSLAPDTIVAERLSHLAESFEAKASDPDTTADQPTPAGLPAAGRHDA